MGHSMEFVRTLAAITRGETDLVGTRAVDLARLHREFQLPPTFVLTNEAFESFVLRNNLHERIVSALRAEVSETRRYDAIRELILGGDFAQEMVAEIVESYESLSTGESLSTLVESEEAPFATVIISPNHHMPSESNEGVILNVRGLEQLLLAVKECWACLFTPTLQRHRRNAGIGARNLNVGVIVERAPRESVTAEAWSATGGDTDTLTVKAYYGHFDISSSVEKDECRVTREYLKPVYQSVGVQTALLTRDEDERLAKLPLGARGEQQKVNDRDLIELARLAKKASQLLEKQVKLIFNVRDTMELLLCNELLLTGGSIKLQGLETEEAIEEDDSIFSSMRRGHEAYERLRAAHGREVTVEIPEEQGELRSFVARLDHGEELTEEEERHFIALVDAYLRERGL